MGVVVLEMGEAQDGRTDIGVIGEDRSELAALLHARADDPEPGVRDLVLEVAVVPGEARTGCGEAAARGSRTPACRAAWCGRRTRQEVVGVAEQRRSSACAPDHARACGAGPARPGRPGPARRCWSRRGRSQRRRRSRAWRRPAARACASVGSVWPGIAVDVERRRIVAMHAERRRIGELGGIDQAQIGVDLAFLAHRCRNVDAVTMAGLGGSPERKVIVLVGGDDEQRIVLGDAVLRKPGEEVAEGLVVVLELRHIACLAGAESAVRMLAAARRKWWLSCASSI